MVVSMLVDAVLFDMDGTLIDSTPGVLKAWETFAADYGLDAAEVAHASHGRRLYDTLQEFCGLTNEDVLLAEVARFEELVIQGGPVALPGSISLLNQIQISSSTVEKYGWTIVTSATSFYTPRALAHCSIPLPPAGFVTSNNVPRGKPFPDPYLAGALRCGLDPGHCLVVEDAPAGIRAGRAAGAKTLAVCTSHTREAILASGAAPDYIVNDLTRVSARWINGRLEVTMNESED